MEPRVVSDADCPEVWARKAGNNGSSIAWVIGKGHQPLGEVRRGLIDDIEKCEALVIQQTATVLELSAQLNQARDKRDRAYNARQETRAKLARLHAQLIEKFPLPPETANGGQSA
jgi:hypothetical protein